MRRVLGVLFIIIGVVLAIYVGLWVMFVGGIVSIIDAVKADPVDGGGITWGIIRIVFASAASTLTFWLCTFVGIATFGTKDL